MMLLRWAERCRAVGDPELIDPRSAIATSGPPDYAPRIERMKKIAHFLRQHRQLILNYFKTQEQIVWLSNGSTRFCSVRLTPGPRNGRVP